MKSIISMVVIFLAIFILSSCKRTPEETDNPIVIEEKTYTNPVYEPILADPSIIRAEDGIFYVFGTQDYGKWNEEYSTKYIPILKSNDLVNWEYASSAFIGSTRPFWGTPNAGLWAPDIVKIGNTYNLYYSLSTWGDPNPGIGVATANHPLGPWIDHGKVFDSLSIGVNNSIDPAVFIGQDDKVYMIWGSFRGLYGIELSSDGLTLKDGNNAKNTKVLIAGLDTSTNWNAATYEGAYVIYKDSYYYLFASSGTCCNGHSSSYNVKVGRSTNPLGPYVDDQNRLMTGTNRGYQVVAASSYFVGTGHNSIVVDDDNTYWILYHAFDLSEPEKLGSTNRRSLMIDKLVWSNDGWPSTIGVMPSNNKQKAPIIKKSNKE